MATEVAVAELLNRCQRYAV